ELRDNTFSGSDHEDANGHIEKVLAIVDLFHIPNITQDQVMLRAFLMSLTGAEVVLFYKGFEVPTRPILDSKGAIPTMIAVNTRIAIQEMVEHSQKWHDGTSTRTKSTETSDRLAAIQAQLNNLGREIKKVNENLYAAQVGYELCKGPHYTKDCPLKEEGKTLEEAYYIQFGMPFPQGEQYRAAAPGFYQRNNANPSSTEINPRDHVKSISTAIDADLNPIRRIGLRRCAVSDLQESKLIPVLSQMTIPFPSRLYAYDYDEEKGSYGLKDLDAYSIGTTLRNDALLQKEKDPGSFTLPCYINNFCFEKALVDLGANHPKGIAENVLVGIGKFVFPIDFIILDIPEDVKVPLILRRPFLSTVHAKIDVFKGKITLRVRDEKIIFKSVKPVSSLIKRVCMISLRERMELDLKARLIGEALILNRSLDPLYEDYIELNDLNEPSELRRNQVDDLEPTIKEGEVVDEPIMDRVKTRYDNEIVDGLDEYPSYCDFDRKIHINCSFNLQFSCMIGYEYVDANFFPLFSINVMSKRFYNSIMKDKVEYKGKNIVGAFMNVPIFVGKFSIVTDFAVVENMDSYRDEGMGDIIVGRPFCKDASH
ncbi:ribonuclease H-like domain, reverse transcriptase, RNA-dependent DNA polymerase, partial [Tanacetum coccineum]